MRVLLALLPLLLACGTADDRTPLVVLASASLTHPLTGLEEDFEAAHPDVDLRLSFAGSQVLAAQVREGAPADVLVTADELTLRSVADRLGPATIVARNQLAVVVAEGRRDVTTLADLATPGLRVVLAGPSVPAGRAARAALAAAGVTVRSLSDEPDVKAVLARVRLGEADAGIAYASDLRDPGVDGTAVPGTSTRYPAAVLRDARRAAQGREFVAYLVGPEGRRALVAAGLQAPP